MGLCKCEASKSAPLEICDNLGWLRFFQLLEPSWQRLSHISRRADFDASHLQGPICSWRRSTCSNSFRFFFILFEAVSQVYQVSPGISWLYLANATISMGMAKEYPCGLPMLCHLPGIMCILYVLYVINLELWLKLVSWYDQYASASASTSTNPAPLPFSR